MREKEGNRKTSRQTENAHKCDKKETQNFEE